MMFIFLILEALICYVHILEMIHFFCIAILILKLFRSDWKWLNRRICRRFKPLKEKCITNCVFQTDEEKDSVMLSFKMSSNWSRAVPKTDMGNIFWLYLYKLIFSDIGKTEIIGIIFEVFWVLCLTRVLITTICHFYEFSWNQIRKS